MRIRTVVGFESSACDLARQNCDSLLHLFFLLLSNFAFARMTKV